MVLIASCLPFRIAHKYFVAGLGIAPSVFHGGYFIKAAQISFCLSILGGEKGLNEIPGHFQSHGPATQAKNVHVIVLDTLPRRKVIVNQAGPRAFDLIGADGRADTAAADGHSHDPRVPPRPPGRAE